MKTKPDSLKIETSPEFQLIEAEENDLFEICPYCDPPKMIYKDKLGMHQAIAHGRPLSDVFEEEDQRRAAEDESRADAEDW